MFKMSALIRLTVANLHYQLSWWYQVILLYSFLELNPFNIWEAQFWILSQASFSLQKFLWLQPVCKDFFFTLNPLTPESD